ncbi:MAG: leucine-rich repeat domain-containing protein, partial [Bacteroidales bacterium]|nr:leucine-rich repeat domain-containing protein [Bacteroidales bacterium]
MSDRDNATLKIKAFRTKGIAGLDFTVGMIAVGDTVKVQGVLMHYVNTTTSEELLEIYKGNLVEVVVGSNAIYYKFDDANLTATVTSEYYNEYTGDVVIPATVTYGGNTYSVTSIGDYAFRGCSGLTSVTIPNSVTSIGGWAFSDCSGLTSVTIPNSVTSIGEWAFKACSGLTSVVWNAKNADCCYFAPFYDIAFQITSFTFGSEVEHIPARLCYGMENLTSVTIPNSVTSIGEEAFSGCSGLTSVVWNAKNCADFAQYYDYSSSKYYYGPFNDSASKITSFTFGSEVEHIPAYLCYGMENLTSVTIPNSVTSIGDFAFGDCSGLTSITIPNSVTSIGSSAFYNCSSLTSVVWNAKKFADFSSSEKAPFYNINSQITSFTFGSEVEHIPARLCYGMENLTSVTIPNSVTSIGKEAFRGCSGLTSIVVESGNTTYDSHNGCNAIIETATNALVVGCQSTIIPNNVTSIGMYAFYGCSGLTSITIPNSVTSIGDYAFDGCSSLTKTNYTGDIAGWCGIHFGNYSANPTAYSHNLYINDVEVKDLVIPNSVTSIGEYAFSGCSGLTSITIPNSVTSIGFGAFEDCSGLTSVTIPNSVTSIGDEAFYYCDGLTSVTIGNSVTSIGDYAFVDCSSLTSVTIPNSVTSIGDGAFSGCSGLTSVTIGNSVTSIGGWAFYGCSDLTSVTIGNSVTSIGEEAFSGCTKLINIVCYAAEPPSCDASVFANYNVFLKVPCNNLTAYQTHVYWGSFKYISCIGSEEVQVTEFSVTPSTNEAQFTWPAEPNAATYELVISKDGVVFCTLTFNASGQLMGIAFAPGANTAATTATSGFQFTVTGLDEASHYTYTFDAKDAGGSVVKHYA